MLAFDRRSFDQKSIRIAAERVRMAARRLRTSLIRLRPLIHWQEANRRRERWRQAPAASGWPASVPALSFGKVYLPEI